MFYEIRANPNKSRFDLFFKKKKGFKFKKSFKTQSSAELYAPFYLETCCLVCQTKGFVYRVRFPSELRSRMKKGARRYIPAGATAICPECRTPYRVDYADSTFEHEGKTYPRKQLFLIAAPGS